MRKIPFVFSWLFAPYLLATNSREIRAAEYGFSTYGLGSSVFGAGVTPPPGTYVSAVAGFYSGDASASINFGGAVINAGAEVEGFTSAPPCPRLPVSNWRRSSNGTDALLVSSHCQPGWSGQG